MTEPEMNIDEAIQQAEERVSDVYRCAPNSKRQWGYKVYVPSRDAWRVPNVGKSYQRAQRNRSKCVARIVLRLMHPDHNDWEFQSIMARLEHKGRLKSKTRDKIKQVQSEIFDA